jgi:hypothetical protein
MCNRPRTSLRLITPAALALLACSSSVFAQTTLDPETQAKILKGFQSAPVSLNMTGRDATLVGLGSYIVNNVGECNGCHSAGPQTEFVAGGSPAFGQKAKTNPATYLGGGRDFGQFPAAGPFPNIISRNLTPDKSGMPVGGMTLAVFTNLIRTGVDIDVIHPSCKGAPNGTCLPAPFVGELLQIMPWSAYAGMTDRDLASIYEYLAAIPCVEGGPNEPANRCTPGAKTTAIAGPKNLTSVSKWIQLDGSASSSSNGGALSYLWTIAPGSPTAGISGSTTPTPSIQLAGGRSIYTFQLTVTDSAGTAATDTVSVNYQGN